MDPILAHISNVLCLFYVNVVGRCFGEVTKNATDPSQHGTLKGAYVHKMTFCVKFLAPHVRTHFRIFIRCSKYTAILMLPRTHVPRMTVCVTFRARLRSIPLSLLDRLFGHLGRQGRPRLPEDFRNGSAERPFGLPKSPKDALQTLLRYARAYIQTSRRVSVVGGSAMHMKWPDGIGREAGIGGTRDRKELNLFRACP